MTLIELLVVITIILTVSVIALPVVLPAMSHRQVSEGARIMSAGLSGARDAAIRNNSLSGIRLLADPAVPNAFNRFVPLSAPPSYTEGLVSCFPATAYTNAVLLNTGALVLEEQVVGTVGGVQVPNNPTTWAWNIRQGDMIQINNAGTWYAVAGPVVTSNPENFINYGPPGTTPPKLSQGLPAEYLLLVNGYDDNQNGYIDEGYDGVDENNNSVIDDLNLIGNGTGEWEQETWRGSLLTGIVGAPYTIRRRPIPANGSREVLLSTNVVINSTLSSLPTSTNDLVVTPDGKWAPSLQYGVPSSITMTGSWYQFWLSERADVGATTPNGSWWLLSLNGKTGRVSSVDSPDLVTGLATARQQ
jgi:type II secretory pathway pseudopilin PulG